MQIRAQTFGPLTPVDDAPAREAHDCLLQPSIVGATFDYRARQTRNICALPVAVGPDRANSGMGASRRAYSVLSVRFRRSE